MRSPVWDSSLSAGDLRTFLDFQCLWVVCKPRAASNSFSSEIFPIKLTRFNELISIFLSVQIDVQEGPPVWDSSLSAGDLRPFLELGTRAPKIWRNAFAFHLKSAQNGIYQHPKIPHLVNSPCERKISAPRKFSVRKSMQIDANLARRMAPALRRSCGDVFGCV